MADAALVLSLEPEVAAQMTVEAQGVFEPRADIVGNYLREIYASDELEPINEVGSRRHMQELRIALKEIDLKASRGELMPRKFAVDIAKGDLIALIAAVNQLRFYWHGADTDVPDKIEAVINRVRHRFADRCENPK